MKFLDMQLRYVMKVSKFQLNYIILFHLHKDTLIKQESGSELFPDGETPEIGAIIKRSLLGKTLKRLSIDGPEYFYTGSVAKENFRKQLIM